MAHPSHSRPSTPLVHRLLPGMAGLLLGGLAGLVTPPAAGAGEITATGGGLSLGTLVNGRQAGSCSSGDCAIGGGTRAGANLFHRFSAFDTRGGIRGVQFDTQGQRLLVVGVTNPLGSFLDKPISFSSPASLIWLSPGGISLGGGVSFSNIPSLQLSTATGLRFAGGGQFDVFGTTAAGVAGLSGDPLAGSAGLLSDPAARLEAGLSANGDVTLSEGLLTVDHSLLLDAQGGHLLLDGAAVQAGGSGGAPGGLIALTGASVSLRGSSLEASGASGGGTVLVGGAVAGGPGLAPAATTLVDGASTIRADATLKGAGGTVVVWSENATTVDGAISARGGPAGGDGGFVETSGKRQLAVSQAPDASASLGKGGTWLLDPNNLTVNSTGPSSNITSLPSVFTTADNAVIAAFTINNALNSGTSVSLTTSAGGTQAGDIILSAPISKTAGGDASLSLSAHYRLLLDAPITSTAGKLNLNLKPDSDDNGSGNIQLGSAATLQLNGGTVRFDDGATDTKLRNTIENSRIEKTGSLPLISSNSKWRDVTIASSFDVDGDVTLLGSSVTLADGVTLRWVNAWDWYVQSTPFEIKSTTAGKAVIERPDGGALNLLYAGGPYTLTIGEGMTLKGPGVISGYSNPGKLINNGEIVNATPLQTLSLAVTSLENRGTIQASEGTLSLTTTTPFSNEGTLTVGNGILSTGNLSISNASSGTISSSGSGSLNLGSGTLSNAGTISPGGPGAVGSLTINGNLDLSPSSSLLIVDLLASGSSAGSSGGLASALAYDHDTLTVNGAVTLGGGLSVSLTPANSSPPQAGASFDILTSTSPIRGNFDPASTSLPVSMSAALVDSPLASSPTYRLSQGPPPSTCPGFCWDGGGGLDTLWSTAANWVNDAIPGGLAGSGDLVYFDLPGSTTITLNDTRTIEALFSAGGNTLTILGGGSLSIGGSTLLSDLQGGLVIEGGNLTVNGLGAQVSGLQLSSGSLTGNGPVTLQGTTNSWGGGAISGPTVSVGSGALLTLNGDTKYFGDSTLATEVGGRINWTAGEIRTYSNRLGLEGYSSRLVNNAGTFDIQGDLTWSRQDFNLETGTDDYIVPFSNSGTLLKSAGTFTARLGDSFEVGGKIYSGSVRVSNSGLVEASSGTLRLSAGPTVFNGGANTTSSGEFKASTATSAIDFFSGNPGLIDGARLSGAGVNRVSGAFLHLIGSSLTPSNYEVSNLILTGERGGAIIGDFYGTLSIKGATSAWSGGAITGASLLVKDGATFTLNGTGKAYGDTTLATEVGGRINWSSGNLSIYSGKPWPEGSGSRAVVNAGTFDIQADLTWERSISAAGGDYTLPFSNSGILRKSGGSGTAKLGDSFQFGESTYSGFVDLTNAGLVDVQSGTLQLTANNFSQSGTLHTASGAAFVRSGGFTNTGTISGSGSIDVGSGSLVNQGTIIPGGAGSVGTLTVQGSLVLGQDSQLQIDLLGSTSSLPGAFRHDELQVSGVTTLGGLLAVSATNYTPAFGDQLDVIRSPGGFSSGSQFASSALPPGMSGAVAGDVVYRLTEGSGSCPGFCWDGGGGLDTLWSNRANWLNDVLPPGGSGGSGDVVYFYLPGASTITVNDSRTIAALFSSPGKDLTILSGGSLSLAGTSQSSAVYGALTLENGGGLSVGGAATLGGGFQQTGGLLTGSGTLTLEGQTNRWSGGVWGGGGTTQLAGSLRIGSYDNAANPTLLTGRTIAVAAGGNLELEGMLKVQDGSANTLSVQPGGTLTAVRAPYTATGEPTYNGILVTQGQLDLLNEGRLRVQDAVITTLRADGKASRISWSGSGSTEIGVEASSEQAIGSSLQLYTTPYGTDLSATGVAADLSGYLGLYNAATLASTSSALTIRAPGAGLSLNGTLVVNAGSTLIDYRGVANTPWIGAIQLIDGTLTLEGAAGYAEVKRLAEPASGDTFLHDGISIGSYTQSGGTLSGSGSIDITTSFSRSGGTIDPFAFSRVSIQQSSGTLSPGALSVSGPLSFDAFDGLLMLDAPLVAETIHGRGAAGVLLLEGTLLTATGSSGRTIGFAAGFDQEGLPIDVADPVARTAPTGFSAAATPSAIPTFRNEAGDRAFNLKAGEGNAYWEVYAVDPFSNPSSDLGGLPYAFKQYGKTPFDAVPVAGSGNGLFYANTPLLSVNLLSTPAAPLSKVYDGTTSAVLSPANYGLSGAVSGDHVSLVTPASGFYANRNAGTAKTVSVSGLAVLGASESSTGVPVYGYSLPEPTASGPVGTITPAPLTISAVTDSRVYNGGTDSSGIPRISAGQLFGGDSLGNLSQSYTSRNVLGPGGSTLVVNPTYLLNDGNGGNNYAVTLASASGTITPAEITVTFASDSTINQPILNPGTGTVTTTGTVLFGQFQGVTAADSGKVALVVVDAPSGMEEAAQDGAPPGVGQEEAATSGNQGGSASGRTPAVTLVGEEAGNYAVTNVTVNSGGRSVTYPVTPLPSGSSRSAAVTREQGSGGVAQRLNLVLDTSQQQALTPEQVQALLGQAMQAVQEGAGR